MGLPEERLPLLCLKPSGAADSGTFISVICGDWEEIWGFCQYKGTKTSAIDHKKAPLMI
jgi:hypothetical protein